MADQNRNLNPHAEARLAMAIWGEEYAYKQTGGSMDFWDSRTDRQKALCVSIVDAVMKAAEENGRAGPPSVKECGTPPPQAQMVATYVVWSNEHKCWWGPNHAGYCLRLEDAGRYTRDEALKICVNARGGRQFNSNPSEVPLPLEDAERFWPDDRDEWRVARLKHERPELWEDEE